MNAQDQALQHRVTTSFAVQFGHAPDLVVRAPGRVNLTGEHTDYNDGFILPFAIGPANMVAISKRDDDRVDVVAADFDDARDTFALKPPPERNLSQPWADYVRGTFLASKRTATPSAALKSPLRAICPKGQACPHLPRSRWRWARPIWRLTVSTSTTAASRKSRKKRSAILSARNAASWIN